MVPVGKDQKQHVEMTRDIAQKINNHFDNDFFTIPEPQIDKVVQTIPGIDGQKMSKSYGNTIPIFGTEKEIKKSIMSIQTESIDLGTPIDTNTCNVFSFHKLFKNPNLKELEKRYKEGSIGFGESKKQLFELIWEYFSNAREKRIKLKKDPKLIEDFLKTGAIKARKISFKKLEKMRKKMGLPKRSILS
jgi:tryptophanyl-tRNA synthetase